MDGNGLDKEKNRSREGGVMERNERGGASQAGNAKRPCAFMLLSFSYLCGLAAAIVVGNALVRQSTLHPLWATLVADVAATIVIFIFSVVFNNVSFYDPYWSVQPMALALFWLIRTPDQLTLRQLLVLGCLFFWGIRLTVHWAVQWRGLRHEDWRYTRYRRKGSVQFWVVAFTGLELMPTLLVYLGCVAFYPALAVNPRGIGVLDGLAVLVAMGAAFIELAADRQMKSFLQQNPAEATLMERGLWARSRHPNYFGEVSFWWGLYLFTLAAAPSWWWTMAGPAAITLLFLFISIPLMENRQVIRRPSYDSYRRRVSVFVPWFPKRDRE
jgi:steroid 5-alpha reductase family enzyme